MHTLQFVADTLHRVNPRLFHSHCFYCGVRLTTTNPRLVTHYTKDHVYPMAQTMGKFGKRYVYAKGGVRLPNVVPCCLGCNRLKSSLRTHEWRVVFFGAHEGKFWAEQLVDGPRCVEFLPLQADLSKVPAPL